MARGLLHITLDFFFIRLSRKGLKIQFLFVINYSSESVIEFFFHCFPTDELTFSINRLVKPTEATSEDEDNNNTYEHKSSPICDSTHELVNNIHHASRHHFLREFRSRSRSQSRSPRDDMRSRSRSSSLELEVDSPPPLPAKSISVSESPVTELSTSSKKSEIFSVSALLRQDEPRTSKSPVPVGPLEAFRNSYTSTGYDHQAAMLHRSILPQLPWWATLAFHQGQQQPGAPGR